MIVYITKKSHGIYNYLANWIDPRSGYGFGEWFCTMQDLRDYTAAWEAEYIRVNF